VEVDEVEHSVEPLGRRGVGTVVWVLAVDEAADGNAVVLLIGEFSDESCVTRLVVGEREVARAQACTAQSGLDGRGDFRMLAKAQHAPTLRGRAGRLGASSRANNHRPDGIRRTAIAHRG
jgi:hypothetical protein